MPLFTLNGVEVPVAQASSTRLTLGKDSRAFSGALRLGRRGSRREWRFTTPPLPLDEATAVRGLVEGVGESWGFGGSLYSDAGLNHSPSLLKGSYTYGSDSTLIVGSGSNQIVFQLEKSADWTLLLLAVTPNYVAWHTAIRCSDGRSWRNGKPDDVLDLRGYAYDAKSGRLTLKPLDADAVDWGGEQVRAVGSRARANGYVYEVTVAGTTGVVDVLGTPGTRTLGSIVSDGSVTWRNMGIVAGLRVARLAWLPYRVPDAWIPQLTVAFGFGSAGRFLLPRLQTSGLSAPMATETVLGEVTDAKTLQFIRGGSLTIGEQLTFLLREV